MVSVNFCYLISGVLFLCAPAWSAKPAREFLVIGNPSVCALYDQYEQALTPTRKKALPTNAPFEIRDNRELMGDQISQAMRLSLLGTTYYLLLDDKGNITGLPPSASPVRYRGCMPGYDTLTVVAASLSLTRKPSGGGSIATLNNGAAVLRIFTWQGSAYVLSASPDPRYGWCRSSERLLRPIVQKSASTGSDFALLHQRIMKRLIEANDRYDTLFSYFSSRTRQEKSKPEWVADPTVDRQYILRGSDEVVTVLENSTRYLVRDIERMLLGKPFLVSYRKGIISIESR
jgi:hypothetical protein